VAAQHFIIDFWERTTFYSMGEKATRLRSLTEFTLLIYPELSRPQIIAWLRHIPMYIHLDELRHI